MALYARVSTEEQTRGSYPSCSSQVEELEAACRSRGWIVQHIIRDEGFSAGSLKRPGLSELRWLVQTNEIDGIICTWYDRLTRSRDFYVLSKEFQSHDVEFITLHDATDTTTAAGRFMESMLVAAKTYEREQTSEKVRSKMRMRATKGMWNGGPIPFGFTAVSSDRTIAPNLETSTIVTEMFRIYIETSSDFKVRDWLRAHQVPTHGASQWQVSSVRRILTNRRYAGEIEINRENKGLADLPESEAYLVVKAPYEPVVPLELFDKAQAIRHEKSKGNPNRKGRPRSYSQTQCGRVYTLQALLVCGRCGHAMAPYYVRHRAGEDKSAKKRKKDSFITYYICAKQQKDWKGCDHKNLVSARRPEAWILDKVKELATSEDIIERAMQKALMNSATDLEPSRQTLSLTRDALLKNQTQVDALVESLTVGGAQGALWALLNERATRLKAERDGLLFEQRRLQELLAPLDNHFDADVQRSLLLRFGELAGVAEPEELQRLLRLMVRRVEWEPDGAHRVQFYHLQKPNCLPSAQAGRQWFQTVVCNDIP